MKVKLLASLPSSQFGSIFINFVISLSRGFILCNKINLHISNQFAEHYQGMKS